MCCGRGDKFFLRVRCSGCEWIEAGFDIPEYWTDQETSFPVACLPDVSGLMMS